MRKPLSATLVICCAPVGLWQCHCCQMLCGLGKVQEPLACPNLQTPRGKVNVAWVRSAIIHGNETWGPQEPELRQLRRNERAIIRWICGIKDRYETSTASLLQNLDIENLSSVLRCRRLRCNDHVQRASSYTKSITIFRFPALEKRKVPDDMNVGRRMSMSMA